MMLTTQQRAARRSLQIFALVILITDAFVAWLHREGIGADQSGGLAMLIWLVVPVAMALALSLAEGKDAVRSLGLAPRFAGNGALYLIAQLVPVGLIAALFGVALYAGNLSLTPMAPGLIAAAALPIALFSLFKNLFEELAWRGFLTARFERAGVHDLVADLLTGLIWASWHLPYWLAFLSVEQVRAQAGLSPGGLVALGFIALPLQALFFGELRRASGSFWLAWLGHTAANAAAAVTLGSGWAVLTGSGFALCVPGAQGLGFSLALAAIGLGLRARRLGRATRMAALSAP